MASIKLSGPIDTGFTRGAPGPDTNINYGRLFDDRADTLLQRPPLQRQPGQSKDQLTFGLDVALTFQKQDGCPSLPLCGVYSARRQCPANFYRSFV